LCDQQGSGEWDASARQFEEIQRRGHEAGETYRPPWRTRIEDDTPMVPRAVAEQVCEGASLWLGEPFPREWVGELAERANVVYQHNARFRRLLRKPGDAGNDWLAAWFISRRESLAKSPETQDYWVEPAAPFYEQVMSGRARPRPRCVADVPWTRPSPPLP